MHRIKAAPAAAMVEGGTVTGYAATFDREPDAYGDVIAPGAFAKSLERWAGLRESGKYIPLLYGHSTDDPAYNIGRVVDAVEDEKGLLVTAEFDAENEKAQYVRKLVQEGRLYQFSFAYEVRDAAETDIEGYGRAVELRDLELYEVSLVQIPANQNAVVIDVKSAPKSGRVLSSKNAEAIKEAINLLQSVLDGAGMGEQPEEDGDAAKANPAGEEPDAKRNARIEALLAAIDNQRKD